MEVRKELFLNHNWQIKKSNDIKNWLLFSDYFNVDAVLLNMNNVIIINNYQSYQMYVTDLKFPTMSNVTRGKVLFDPLL